MTSKHTAPKHTLTDYFFSVCNWKDYILAEEFSSCCGWLMSLVFFLYCWTYTEVSAWRRHVDWILLQSSAPRRWLTPVSYVEVSLPAAGPGCLLLSVELSAPGDLRQAGWTARETVSGWFTWNIFPCIIHAWRGPDLQIEHLSYDRYPSWLNLTCSYNFRDATVLVMRSAIPSASWLVSSPVTRSHSSFSIFYFSIFRVWTTNSALFYTVFYTISFIVFVSGAQIVTAWGVRRFWSHSLSIAHHL